MDKYETLGEKCRDQAAKIGREDSREDYIEGLEVMVEILQEEIEAAKELSRN